MKKLVLVIIAMIFIVCGCYNDKMNTAKTEESLDMAKLRLLLNLQNEKTGVKRVNGIINEGMYIPIAGQTYIYEYYSYDKLEELVKSGNTNDLLNKITTNSYIILDYNGARALHWGNFNKLDDFNGVNSKSAEGLTDFTNSTLVKDMVDGVEKKADGSAKDLDTGTNLPKLIKNNLPLEISPDPSNLNALITGKKYYIDPVNGTDTLGDGSSEKPWASIPKAVTVAVGGDGIFLRNGDYGNLVYSKQAASYIVIQNDTGCVPKFSSISIAPGGEVIKDIYVVFSGVYVKYNKPNTTNDGSVTVRYSSKVRLYNSEIIGASKYLTEMGVYPTYSKDVIIANCNIHDTWRAISYTRCTGVAIYYNHIHGIAGSAIHTGTGGSSNIDVIGNHIHNSNYSFADAECPPTPDNPHGSGVSIRHSNMNIRNNIIHDGFNTAGITFYDNGDPVLNDVTIENNLLYDIRNYYTIRLSTAGNNIRINNNTVIGHYRYPDDTDKSKITISVPLRYDSVFYFTTMAAGYENAKSISIYNNIFYGCYNVNKVNSANITQGNNIFYSYKDSLNYQYNTAEIGNGSIVLTDDTSKYQGDDIAFTYFNGNLRFDQNAVDPNLDVRGHGQPLEYTLKTTSPAIGFGDSRYQPVDSLGMINSDGFIVRSDITRNSERHDAGAYQR